MARAFYERLKDYYRSVGAVLRGEAASASIFPNTTDIGMSREKVYATFLRQHLPSSCNVLFGGFLFNLEGDESKQIDVIVTNDTCPQYNLHNQTGEGKSFACVEGALAVVSLKSSLTTRELEDSLENFASIPNKLPLGNRVNPLLDIRTYDNWPFKIIYATKGIALETATESLTQYYQRQHDIPNRLRPDLIHVAGSYFISRVYASSEEENRLQDTTACVFEGVSDPTDVTPLGIAVHGIQEYCVRSKHILFGYNQILQNLIGQ